MFDKHIKDLTHSKSARRRSAAKQLRRLGDPCAGPHLLQALKEEARNPKTWETQYQMVMALGECGYQEATPVLRDLARNHKLEYMVHLAIGDALTRLSSEPEEELLQLLSTANQGLSEGALRAVALVQLKLTSPVIDRILEFVSEPKNEHLVFWVAAGAPEWEGPKVTEFLRRCTESSTAETRKAAQAALEGRFLTWNVL